MLSLTIRSAQLALAVAAVALVWTAVLPLASSATPLAVAPASAPARTEPPTRSLPRYRVITDRNLFRAPIEEVAPAPAPVATIEESRLNVELFGTAVVSDNLLPDLEGGPEATTDAPALNRDGTLAEQPGSVAVLRDTDGSIVTKKIGETLDNGSATLVGIEPRRIVIEHSGRLEAVTLPEPGKSGRPASSRTARIPSQAPRVRASPQRGRRIQPRGTPNAQSLQQLSALRRMGQFTQATNAQGEAAGIEVTGVLEGSLLEKLGIREGDRISAINGETAQPGASVGQILANMNPSEGVVLTVEGPGGDKREIPVSADQLLEALR